MLTKSELKLIADSLEIHAGELLKALKMARNLSLPDKSIVAKYKKVYKLIEKIS